MTPLKSTRSSLAQSLQSREAESSEPEYPDFGSVIREARKKYGWSQSELGDQSGVSHPTIARVEANNDVTTATTATTAKIAQTRGHTLELKDRG